MNNTPTPEGIKISPEQKLIESLKLYYLARELKRSSLLEFQPGLNPEEIDKKIADNFINARS